MDREIILAVVGSTAFTAIVNTVLEIIKNKTGRKSKTDKAINFCLLSDIQEYGLKLIEKNAISREEYNQFCEMYDCYKSLGGNGFVDKMKNEVDKLVKF